jgi:SAM-dependent methyltransferase
VTLRLTGSSIESVLVCPECQARPERRDEAYVCTECGARYLINGGIGLLLNCNHAGADRDESTQRQREYFDRDAAFEVTRPHGLPRLHQWLLAEKFRRSVSELRSVLNGAIVLSVCGGSGMDAEFLARAGARVILVDIALGAAKRAKERAERFDLPIFPLVADAVQLPLADRSVDVAYVHDGLHHLERPLAGVAEMCRVARQAISITEPARAVVTAAAVKAGLALEVEEAGNRVERLTLAEIAQELERHGFQVLRGERYAMYYRHRPGPVARWLSAPGAFELTKAGFNGLNLLAGRFGNKLTVQAVRGGYQAVRGGY